jgi:uncharacterized protein (TIGR02391 family)
MTVELESLLHPRILKNCISRFKDSYYKDAAREAMVQVEQAMKEKTGVDNKYGVNLCRSIFGDGKGLKLRVPFGEQQQKSAEQLFSAVFSYYRNYAVHDGTFINETICLRIMILASELLDLIGASDLSFADVGSVEGLIKEGVFSDHKELSDLLRLIDRYYIIDDANDGLFEKLALNGFSEDQYIAVLELDLAEYQEVPYKPRPEEIYRQDAPETVGWFELTHLGKFVVESLKD